MTRREAELAAHPLPEVKPGDRCAVPLYDYSRHENIYHEAVVVTPEAYWPIKRQDYETRVETEDGKRSWVPRKHLILREQ